MSNRSDHFPENIYSPFMCFRRENLFSCFTALCEAGNMTRAELASATNLSIMTTGKIADAMIECGVLTEAKHPCAGAGRRPGTLRFSCKPAFLILNGASRKLTAHVLSPGMQSKEIYIHDYNDVFPFDDNLLIFLNAVRRGCNASKDALPYMAVITAPDEDIRQSITRSLSVSPHSKKHMIDYIEKIMRRECTMILDDVTAAQHYLNTSSAFRNAECGAYICLSDMIYAAVWTRGNLLCPRVCRIGELIMPDRLRIADALSDAYCTEDAIEPIAYAISSLETFFAPDCMLIESDRFHVDEVFLESVYQALVPILPEKNRLIPLYKTEAEPCAAVCGCACELRRKWFYDLTGLG